MSASEVSCNKAGDGFGPFTVPKDPDNLDSKINPYAIDVPLDGIDQDHLAGDLVEIDPFVKKAGFPKLDPNKAKKNVIIIVVETFRVDVAEDPAVMPFINTLVRDHNTFTTVYSNYGVTSRAIQSIFLAGFPILQKVGASLMNSVITAI